MRSQWQLHWQGATWATGHLLSRPASDDEETAGHTAEASPKCDAWTSSEAERYTATLLPRSTHSCLCFYLLCVLMHWCTGSQWVNHSSLKHLKYSNRSYLLLHVNTLQLYYLQAIHHLLSPPSSFTQTSSTAAVVIWSSAPNWYATWCLRLQQQLQLYFIQ